MNAVAQQDRLKQIAQKLQEQLQPRSPSIPLQVQCALKDSLMVLVQHPPGNAPSPQQVFETLERSILELPNELTAPIVEAQGAKVKLFLRVLGQPKPYAHHTIELVPALFQFDPEALFRSSESATTSFATTPVVDEAPVAAEPESTAESSDESGRLAVYKEEFALEDSRPLPDYDARETQGLKPRRLTLPPWFWLSAGGVVTAVLVGSSVFALTRPCVVGGCPSLQQAQTLVQRSAQTVRSGGSFQQSTADLLEAQRLAGAIPPWSSYYGEAQAFKQRLSQVLAAETKAASATQKAEAAAQPIAEWQTTQTLWKDAIAQMATVPKDSPLFGFAQERLIAYRANLLFADQRIKAEQDAQQRLNTAKKTAGLAEARQNTAQQLPEWQLAQSTWQVAINNLTQVPKGTTSQAEAQQLMEGYTQKLRAVSDRATKEQQAAKVYAQAQSAAQRAKALQQQNQWAQAVTAWQAALAAAKQIPDGTSLVDQAQTLAATYTGSLKQAESVARVRSDLERICTAEGKICDYTITNAVIDVRFSPSYERRVRTLGGLSSFAGDAETLYKIDSHLASLRTALQTVCTNSGVPMAVYNSDNQQIGSLIPGG
ncbi:hypothetical protein JOY44_11980 [Phormidium sp. CLA17]|uniref:hypothetical protein n=1 Tax=Leptolyngbya sp. Cla-17 TaxID=2803751 RepID=UPI0014924296|nr:hypothetical protein [Leptolyngbya sp. Cla-17]MBM0742329.1 hypothetical protein [Leptolyngbya sp. Cla-17]